MFANGEIAADKSLYSPSASELPGFAYYAKAVAIMERLPSTSKDLTALQCRVLMTTYLSLATRILEAWKNITQASQGCIILLKAKIDGQASNEFNEAFRRIYWYALLHSTHYLNSVLASLPIKRTSIFTL